MPLGLAAGIISLKIDVVSVPEADGCRRSFASEKLSPREPLRAMGAVNRGSKIASTGRTIVGKRELGSRTPRPVRGGGGK
jgi:hypothetical protein